MAVGEIRATLIADGTSDRALVAVLNWMFSGLSVRAQVRYADLGILAKPPSGILERARAALRLYPADILFVHRDAEVEAADRRYQEIAVALSNERLRYVPIVPVRMTEAWFLFDESAIRVAAGNPNGTVALALPALDRLESIPDPKDLLRTAFVNASELSPRRRSRFRVNQAFQRLAELIDDFAPLRALSSFNALEKAIAQTYAEVIQAEAVLHAENEG